MTFLSIHWGFSLGGIAKYAASIEKLKELMPSRLLSLVILPKGRIVDADSLSSLNATIISLNRIANPSWIILVRKIIQNENPDYIMSHGFNGHLISLLSCFWKNPTPLRLASYHGEYHAPNALKRLLAPIYNNFTLWFLKYNAVSTICVAQYCADFLIAKGVSANRLTVIHNGISDFKSVFNSRNDIRREWGFKSNHIVIGATSRLAHVKGLHYLIDAFSIVTKKFPSTRLVLIGDGPCQKALKQQVVSLGIKNNVFFAGIRTDVSRCLLAMEIFALPSLAEYHSIGLLEAMRAGLPSIVTDVGGNTESVRNEREGLVVPSADAKALAAAIKRLVEDSLLAKQLGLAARERFTNEFKQDAMLQKTAEWLRIISLYKI